MMKQLKGLGFGKSLKLLFSILLIGFFGLGVNSFANATIQQVGSYQNNANQSSFQVAFTRSGNPLTMSLGYTKQFFQIYSYGGYYSSRWWVNGLPYVYICISSSSCWQGNINSYNVCDELTSSSTSPYNCSNVSVSDSTKEVFGNFLSSLTTDDYIYYSYNTRYSATTFCISNSSIGNSLCFGSQSNSQNTIVGSSLGLANGLTFDGIESSYLGNPPNYQGGGDSLTGGTIIYSGAVLTNQEVYDGLLNMGFYQDLCYGDYNSSSLIDSSLGINQFFDGGDCEDGQAYCGMDLVSVYDYTTSNSSLTRTPESRYKNNFNLFKLSYTKDDLTNWNGKLKALWKIMFKVYNNEFNENFRGSDFLTFCRMTKDIKDGNFDGDSPYDGDTYNLNENTISYVNNVVENKYSDWVRVLSGAEFSGYTNLFDMFDGLYGKAINIFNLDNEDSSTVGFLPNFIIFGFFMFLLLYILKR